MRSKPSFVKHGVLILAGAMWLLAQSSQALAYTNSRLMDNAVFDNSGTMNEAQIQTFLASKGPCLQNFRTEEPSWDGTTWSYTGSVLASRVIWKVSQQWGMNPQAIIATLDKEESLVSGTSCDPWRYNSALGYGCPDSGGCNARYAGFTRQVLWGSWQLKFGRERSEGNLAWDGDGDLSYVGYMTRGNFKRCNSCATVFYDGYATIDGQSIYLENGTTASLYSYTPHLGQSFPGIFERWFGPSITGYLARATGSPSVYLINGGSRYFIGSTDILNTFNNFGPLRVVDSGFLSSLTAGPDLIRLARDSASGTVYLLDAGNKYTFSNCQQVIDYGFSCAGALDLPLDILNRFPLVATFSDQIKASNGAVFKVEAGKKRTVPDPDTWAASGLSTHPLIQISDGMIGNIPDGAPILRDQVVVINNNTGQLSFFVGGAARYVPSIEIYLDWRFSSWPTYRFPDLMLSQLAAGPIVTAYAQDSLGNKYLMDQQTKRPLSTTDTAAWAGNYTSLPDAVINAVPTGSAPGTLVKPLGSGAIYHIEAGKKRYIPSMDDFFRSGLNLSNIATVRASNINGVPDGILKFGSLRLIKQASDGLVVMVDSPSPYKVPSPDVAAALGLDLGSTWTVDAATFANYFASTYLRQMLTDGTNNYLADGGSRHLITSDIAAAYSYSASSYQTVSNLATGNLAAGQNLTRFLKSSSAQIYYIESGQRRPIVSIQTYNQLGGPGNTMTVSDGFLQTLPLGSPLN